MPVKIVSKVNRPQTFNIVCMAERVRRDTFEYDPATGHRHRMRGYVRMPASITLAAKERTKLLPDAVETEVEVANAARLGFIKVIRVSSDEAERESAAERLKAKKATRRADNPAPGVARTTSASKPKTEPKRRETETAKKD